jgi:rubrerythrin
MAAMHEAAFEAAIAIEARSLNFYRAATAKVQDPNTKKIFELLALEEARHLESFCSLYQGSDDELVRIVGTCYQNVCADPVYGLLLSSVDDARYEREAIRIALREEQACIDSYTVFVEAIREPHIHEVFATALEETQRHLAMIADEYQRLMDLEDGMDHQTSAGAKPAERHD